MFRNRFCQIGFGLLNLVITLETCEDGKF